MQSQLYTAEDGSQVFKHDTDFNFELGGKINPLSLVFETHGQLNRKKDNVILIHHALTPSHHVASTEQNPTPGWWENMVGPGKPIDSQKYFIICINNLGSCFGSSSPVSLNPSVNQPYRLSFPQYTMIDIVRSQKLLLDHLGIKNLLAIIGSSMGGMLSLEWAIHYPDMVQRLISISSCYKAYPANIINRVIQREVIKLDSEWKDGNYNNNALTGLTLARKLGHFTYRNPDDLNNKFRESFKEQISEPCEIENYFSYQAEKFSKNYDPNCYLLLLNAMDLFNTSRGYEKEAEVFNKILAEVLIVSVDSDVLFTPEQQDDLYQMMRVANNDVSFIKHHSSYGHDAFLKETDVMGKYISDFIK